MTTVYLLGAGASHEAGVPLSQHILPAGLELVRLLERRAQDPRVVDVHPYLKELTQHQAEEFRNLYAWIGDVFHGGTLEHDYLPPIDAL